MRGWYVVRLVLLSGLLGVAGAESPEPIPGEDLSRWEWYQAVIVPPQAVQGAGPKLVDLIVPPSVFTVARADLGDLRLIDGVGQPIPYALRVLRDQNEQRPVPARLFNRSWHKDTGVAEVTLDLGETPPEHNTILIDTRGRGYRRALKLEGSDDGMRWAIVADQEWLVNFTTEAGTIDIRRFNYSPSRFRYLRLQVTRDRSLPNDEPHVGQVEVFHTVKMPGETVTLQAEPGLREPMPGKGGPGSSWLIDLGGSVPVEKLLVEVQDEAFVRPFTLEVCDPGEPTRFLAQGNWQRQAGEERRPLEISFPEVRARRLRLIVTDFRNPPLNLVRVNYSAPARQVVFEPPATLPVKLYVGNPQADPPHYAFAANLPRKLDPAPTRTQVDSLEQNPGYRPLPKPWSERHPWLVDAVLASASAVLLVILGLLGWTALQRHDAG